MFYFCQFSGGRINNKTTHHNIIRDKRMMFNNVHTAANSLAAIVKTAQPCPQIHPTIFHHVNMILRNASLAHVIQHGFAVHVLCSAVGMPDNHHLFHPPVHKWQPTDSALHCQKGELSSHRHSLSSSHRRFLSLTKPEAIP